MDELRDRTAGGGDGERRVLVLNPASGGGDHAERVRELAEERGFEVRATEGAGDAIALAREAAGEADLVAAGGGDGTLNEVVRGLHQAEALDRVDVAVVPLGTGNNFAGNVGVTGVEHAFEVVERGERRRIDLGFAGDRPFVNSCVGGLTADASADTDHESKSALGVLAYVVEAFRRAVEFDGLSLEIETEDSDAGGWSGDAAVVLIGNGRRFPARGSTQANMEDGRLDVTIVEEHPAPELASELTAERLLGADAPHVTRLRASALEIEVLEDGEANFSLDGEMLTAADLTVSTRHGGLSMAVGEGYRVDPGG